MPRVDLSRWVLRVCLLATAGACEQSSDDAHAPEPVTPPATPTAAIAAADPPGAPQATPAQWPAPKAGEEALVPAGSVRLGSTVGSAFRNAPSEADAVAIEVPAFHIDRLPYPNDPAVAPTVAVDRSQAAALCAKNGKRLCGEIEWERACKGDDDAPFPTLDGQWLDTDPCGSDGSGCVSGFGVWRMGTKGREWTASNATRGLGDRLRTAVVRGAAADAPAGAHRCAARDSATPDSRSQTLGFRCCRGETSKLSYPIEPVRRAFELKPMSAEQTRALIAGWPEVRSLAATFVPFEGEDYARALSKGGKTRETIAPWIPAERPLLWSPVHGEQILVLTGKSEAGAAILFAYVSEPDGAYTFGGSFELAGEPDPVVVAFNPESQRELLWSSCWGCGGEGGAITLRDDGRVVIVQR